jgi:hypothetical protein
MVVLLVTSVAIWTLLITTIDAPTNWLPVTLRMKVPLASEAEIEVGLIEVRTGTGRELLQSGLIAEQPGHANTPSSGIASDHCANREDIQNSWDNHCLAAYHQLTMKMAGEDCTQHRTSQPIRKAPIRQPCDIGNVS